MSVAVGVNGFSAAPREQSSFWLRWGDKGLGAALLLSLDTGEATERAVALCTYLQGGFWTGGDQLSV